VQAAATAASVCSASQKVVNLRLDHNQGKEDRPLQASVTFDAAAATAIKVERIATEEARLGATRLVVNLQLVARTEPTRTYRAHSRHGPEAVVVRRVVLQTLGVRHLRESVT
jgi:hypothetical protein